MKYLHIVNKMIQKNLAMQLNVDGFKSFLLSTTVTNFICDFYLVCNLPRRSPHVWKLRIPHCPNKNLMTNSCARRLGTNDPAVNRFLTTLITYWAAWDGQLKSHMMKWKIFLTVICKMRSTMPSQSTFSRTQKLDNSFSSWTTFSSDLLTLYTFF